MIFIIKYWKIISLLFVVISVVAYIALLRHEISTKTGEIKQLELNIAIQNNAVEQFKADADERLKANEVKLIEATKQAQVFKSKATELQKRKPLTANICKETDDLINSVIR